MVRPDISCGKGLHNIAKMVSESADAVKWLQTNHKLLWYRCAFNPEIKCDYITSNIAETFNN
jgi:hypothetical protein